VSRNVATEAYEQLAAEGFVLGISGAGTFVAHGARLAAAAAAERPAAGDSGDRADEAGPTEGAASALDAARGDGSPEEVDFALGRPALDLVPFRAWCALERECGLAAPARYLGGAPVEGIAELREALCEYLRRRRGMECSPRQVVVTYGAIHGFYLLSSFLVERGSEVAFEDPGHVLAREVFLSRGAAIRPAKVDEEGIVVDELPADSKASLAFVTPSHQFPLGGCLSVQRRIALLEWASSRGCLVVEDDYESEFRYDVAPVSPLQTLDPDNVAYVGTFSKVLFPAIRLGFLVLPERLVGPCLERKRSIDRYCAPFPQLAMARFLAEGRLERHLSRMRRVYRKRRDALAGSLGRHFPGTASAGGLATGLHLAVAFEGLDFDGALVEAIRREGAIVHPVERYAIEKGRRRDALAMGYSHLDPERIERGVLAIARAARR